MRRRRALLLALAVLLAAAGVVAAYVLVKRYQGRNIHGSPTVEFVPSAAPPILKPLPIARGPQIVWPTYGYDPERLHVGPAFSLRPPFRVRWALHAGSLLEFPPAVAYGRLYLGTNAGLFLAVEARTGKVVWRHDLGRCIAASPAVADGVVYESFLNHPPCNATGAGLDGEVIAFDAQTGAIRWRRQIGPTESSPLVAGGSVYVGDWLGKVYALDAGSGALRWSFGTGDKVKGAVSLAGGRLYVGSYDGHVYALDPLTGTQVWRASAQSRLGSLGTFYSTPAVAYGRVYIGSTDGKVYSYGASSGKLRWSYGTGGYVYASPAVWRQLVLVGSYSGTFYAFNAATGDVRWRFQANGPISGSATVLSGVVYFSTLKERTYALEASSGRLLWSFPDGKYSPLVADARHVYLVGYTRLYALVRQ